MCLTVLLMLLMAMVPASCEGEYFIDKHVIMHIFFFCLANCSS